MHIQTNDPKRLWEIQNEFHSYYPYLKLEFFIKKPLKEEAGIPPQHLVHPGAQIGDVSFHSHPLSINIEGTRETRQLEEEFEHKFGLPVQIFRRCGKAWLEATATESWTLDQLNQRGQEQDMLILLSILSVNQNKYDYN